MVTKRKFMKWIGVSVSVAVAVILIAAIAIKLVLTPDNLNKMVGKFSNELLDAQVKTDTIELHIFRNFPRITLSIKNGEIISHALDSIKKDTTASVPPQADTLLKFKSFDVSLSLLKLLASDINIKRASIVSPQIYAYIAPDGTANYNILKSAGNTGTQESVQDTTGGSSMSLSINNISIRNGAHVVYNSAADSLLASMELNRLALRGNLSTDFKRMEFNRARISDFSVSINKSASVKDTLHNASGRFTIDSLDISNRKNGHFNIALLTRTDLKMNDAVVVRDFPFEINGGIIFDTTQALCGRLNNFTVGIAKVPVVFNGIFNITPDSLYTDNICGRIDNMSITEVMKYLPESLQNNFAEIKTNATVSLDVDINGSYKFKTGELPSVTANLDIPNSYIEFEGRQSRINELETHIKAYYSAANKDSSAVEINKITVNGRGISLAANGKVSDIASSDPYINLMFKSSVDLDTLSRLFPSKEGSVFNGKAEAELWVKSGMGNLNLYRIGNADIKGNLSTEKIKVLMPNQGIFAILSGIDVKVGSSENARDASIKKGMKMLATNSTADSIYFKYNDEYMVAATMLRLVGHHSAEGLDQDSTNRKVLPVNGTLSAKNLYVKGTDSASVRMSDPQIKFSILPYHNDYKIPVMNVKTHISRLMARDFANRISISNGDISIEAVLNNTENKIRRQRMQNMLDSLGKIYPGVERDSLFAHHTRVKMAAARKGRGGKTDDFADEDMNFKVDRSLSALIRQWNVSGAITAERSRITTPYLPLRTRLENINFNFTTDKIEFKDTRIAAGQSQFALTGKATGLRNAMLRNSPVGIEGKIKSDTLNFNELLTAVNKGLEFMESDAHIKDSLAMITDEEQLQQAIADEVAVSDTLESQLIIVPGNIKGRLDLDIKYGVYSKLVLQRVAGEMIIKDRCLQVNSFEALTSAGNMELSAFYATRSKEDLSTGFDLELKDMAIEKLVEIMPAVDSLLPMLKSFEGVVNCQITATSKIDTTMNLQLSTLRGVARITGENLVLMDGETFATISKKLKFKNREKNYIDKISVELLLNDNKIEVFPFIAQIDRYKFAISGTQNLDMSFTYNVSILQSPVPFRVGVKIFGNTDDFDFKIGKAQYKSEKLPVFSAVIDSTRVNLREQIANIYRIGIDAALKNSGAIENLQRRKREHDATYTQQLDTLSSEEIRQFEAIEPSAPQTAEPSAEQTLEQTDGQKENLEKD